LTAGRREWPDVPTVFSHLITATIIGGAIFLMEQIREARFQQRAFAGPNLA
jgi:hypothetical protein